jgi:hypothetical protein
MMGRDLEYPTDENMEVSVARLLYRVGRLLAAYALATKDFRQWSVSSGYRPGKYNMQYSPTSAHLTCQAIDLADADRVLQKWILGNQQILEDCALYLEDPSRTPTWTHLQIRPATKRIFMP